MESHRTYYVIGNESYTDNEHYSSLIETKRAVSDKFTLSERQKMFGENHTSMIEKNVWNKETKEYDVQSYTPFICTDSGIRWFATTKDWNKANRYIQDFKLGIY